MNIIVADRVESSEHYLVSSTHGISVQEA